jgi:hypothetical protein
MDEKKPAPICARCSKWMYYSYLVAGKPREGQRCIEGIMGAGERTECHRFSREPGSDDDDPSDIASA